MIGALFTGTALEAGLKFSRGAIIGLVFAGLFAAGGFGFWRGMLAIERMVTEARASGIAKRDAECRAERETVNAQQQAERARQAQAAAATSAAAERTIADLTRSLAEWETRNARPPGPEKSCLSARDLDELNSLRRPGAGAR
jgi:hypothetical protein